MNTAALAGKHVLVTRAIEQAQPLINRIEEAGGIAHVIPLLSFQAIEEAHHIEQVRNSLEHYQWLVFTSANGVRFFFEAFKEDHLRSIIKKANIAVVGHKTKAVLNQYGYQASLLPKHYVAEDLVLVLREHIKEGERVLLPRGNLGRAYLPKALSAYGIEVDDLTIYKTVCPDGAKDHIQSLINEHILLDVITFTSSSAVKHYTQILEGLELEDPFPYARIACIGPIAERTAQEYHLQVDITASTYTIEGLIEAISTYFKEDENH
jgi:uroporphyrinogen-III synthase